MGKEVTIDFSGLYDQDPTNLKIYDSDYLDNASKYSAVGKELESILDRYVKTLNSLSAALSGDFADNIEHFSGDVEFYLNNSVNSIMRSVSNNMKNYINEIDEKDGKMY